MGTGKIVDVDTRKDTIEASLLPRVDHHVLIVKVEEDLLVCLAAIPNVCKDVRQGSV